jgi:ferredoxin
LLIVQPDASGKDIKAAHHVRASGAEGFQGEGDCPPPQDFYQLLNVQPDAAGKDIKAAYHKIVKSCHPDIAGQVAIDICILVTFAYKTLMNPQLRGAYDAEVKAFARNVAEGYTGRPLSKWLRDDPGRGPHDQRAVFVDGNRCIGCRMCVSAAEKTFHLESKWGRARVHTQWWDDEDTIQVAIESCPVDCIHWVKKGDLPVLEWCMFKADLAIVSSKAGEDPFDLAQTFIRKGNERREQLRRQGLSSPSRAEGEFTWGLSDAQIALSVDMQRAWDKLNSTTKQAWTFHERGEDYVPATHYEPVEFAKPPNYATQIAEEVLYLPESVDGKQLLIYAGGQSYRVDNSQLQATTNGLGYRLSKNVADLDPRVRFSAWGSIVNGESDGHGWISVAQAAKRSSARTRVEAR